MRTCWTLAGLEVGALVDGAHDYPRVPLSLGTSWAQLPFGLDHGRAGSGGLRFRCPWALRVGHITRQIIRAEFRPESSADRLRDFMNRPGQIPVDGNFRCHSIRCALLEAMSSRCSWRGGSTSHNESREQSAISAAMRSSSSSTRFPSKPHPPAPPVDPLGRHPHPATRHELRQNGQAIRPNRTLEEESGRRPRAGGRQHRAPRGGASSRCHGSQRR